jgi:transcriptional regulator with XRE-family HTH domain
MVTDPSRSASIRRRREELRLSIDNLADAVPCGASTIQRIERGLSVRASTLISVESALSLLEAERNNKTGALSRREALLFGVYSAAAIELIPAGPGDRKGSKEFFEFVARHPMISATRFPSIHKWKAAFAKGVDIVSKETLEQWLSEVSSIHELVAEVAPEFYPITLFIRNCKLGSVLLATDNQNKSKVGV